MNMPLVSSQYWNLAYGQSPGDVVKDEEGMQTMRIMAHNMAWMMSQLKGRPATEPRTYTNFNSKIQ
jgi:hypothetical protein